MIITNQIPDAGGAAAPPQEPQAPLPTDLPQGSPEASDGTLRLPKSLFDILSPAFDEVGSKLLDSCMKASDFAPLSQPLHNCAKGAEDGEIALFYMDKESIDDTEKWMALMRAADSIRKEAVGIFVFSNALDLAANYQSLLDAWYSQKKLRRAEFILNPKIQEIKSHEDDADRKKKIKKILCLDMLVGRFDEIVEGEKATIAVFIAQRISSGGGATEFLRSVIEDMAIPYKVRNLLEPIVENQNTSAKTKVSGIIDQLEGRPYPSTTTEKEDCTMLGIFLYEFAKKFGPDVAQVPMDFVAKYRLITNRRLIAQLQKDYPLVDF
jgi:hypothetical protein